MIFVFYSFAAVLVFLGYKSLRGGIYYLNFFRRELARPKSNYTPFCSIIAPCRGLDEGLSENLSALFKQDFPSYEIIFVVDNEADAAVSVIKEVSRKNPKPARTVIAGQAINESQKVRSLRQAVLEVSGESEVFVFVDSDARPDKDWLRNLVAPLRDEAIGCATGYRWFIQKRGGFSTALRSVWNASIASALGANLKNNFCWGGSLAVRRQTFEKLDMRGRLKGTLSDDFTFTRAIKENGLSIYFVPQCMTATVEDCNFREFLEFSTRQMKITRVYAAPLWKASFLGSFLFIATFGTGILLLLFLSGYHFWLTLILLLTIYALGFVKARLRLEAVRIVLKDYEKELNQQFLSQVTLWTLTPVIYFYNCMCALLSRKILWRGIGYELKSATETEILTTNKSSN
jgi:ceramide glucosyltransferase